MKVDYLLQQAKKSVVDINNIGFSASVKGQTMLLW